MCERFYNDILQSEATPLKIKVVCRLVRSLETKKAVAILMKHLDVVCAVLEKFMGCYDPADNVNDLFENKKTYSDGLYLDAAAR